MDASHPQGYDQSHAVPSGAWDSDSSVVAGQVDHRGWAQHQHHAQLQQVHHQQQLMQQHGAHDAANTWTQAPAHHGAAPVMYSPMPTPNFETPQFAHTNHQAYHHSWPHPSVHATPSYGHPGAYTPHGMCATPSAYAPYAPSPPTPQAGTNAPMHAEYNEPERRETSDGRFWTAREFNIAYGDLWQRPWEQGAERRAQRAREAEQAAHLADTAAAQIDNESSLQNRAAPIDPAPMGAEICIWNTL